MTLAVLICYNAFNTSSIRIKCEDEESIFQITYRESRLVERDSEDEKENGL